MSDPSIGERCAYCGHGWLVHHAFDYGSLRYYPTGCDHWSQCICKTYRKATTLAESSEETR